MEKIKLNFTSYRYPNSPITETYRAIRTNVTFASISKPLKKILITSSLPGEGKTTVTMNLATVLAQAGNKVIYVNCNLRNPSVAQHLGGGNTGLTNLLTSGGDYKTYIRSVEGLTLDCLASGPLPSNPSELLISKNFSNLLSQLAQDYDYVLLDMPPVMPFTDAVAISHLVDGVILVVESELVSPQVAKEVKNRLEQAGANIIGCVLNQVKIERNKHSHSYYYSGDLEERPNRRL
ncbi:MAG: CpsD/CapB family tyrosine-protein kinase [Synergistaceae bacterium]|nr:CpsD/CapB family tyrosine-protein kinase [Synergistaceae bacterium]